jgi:hypothetical protein
MEGKNQKREAGESLTQQLQAVSTAPILHNTFESPEQLLTQLNEAYMAQQACALGTEERKSSNEQFRRAYEYMYQHGVRFHHDLKSGRYILDESHQ